MQYDKIPGSGRGDARWACQSGYGNCTDYHSLFISIARKRSLPAKFEIGLPISQKNRDGEIGGYHCWASFYVEELGWVPIDISEADKHPELREYYFGNLTADRVSFSVGRDLNLVPQQEGEPLNYFIYPYVEVDGIACEKDAIKTRFVFKDMLAG
jgi:transglutaminase-like putative cysteine protease